MEPSQSPQDAEALLWTCALSPGHCLVWQISWDLEGLLPSHPAEMSRLPASLYLLYVDKTNRGDDRAAPLIYQTRPGPTRDNSLYSSVSSATAATEDSSVVLFRYADTSSRIKECHFFVGSFCANYKFGHRHTTWRGPSAQKDLSPSLCPIRFLPATTREFSSCALRILSARLTRLGWFRWPLVNISKILKGWSCLTFTKNRI